MRIVGSRHLAGIVPVSREPLDFKFEWHDCLMPIAPKYHAIERAVYECAMVGCHTIWIVASDDTTPLVRHKMGDFVMDPASLKKKKVEWPMEHRKPVPIFYVPIPMQEYVKRMCYPWSILQGALTVDEISVNISKWLVPELYYVASPYAVYEVKELRKHRVDIMRQESTILTYQGSSVCSGAHLGFTFNRDARDKAIKIFRDFEAEHVWWSSPKEEEKHFLDNFRLEKVFGDVILEERKEIELNWFYPIDEWDKYCEYLASDERRDIKHPGRLVLSYKEWNPIGIDDGEKN